MVFRDKEEERLFWGNSVLNLRHQAACLQLFGIIAWMSSRILARPGAVFDEWDTSIAFVGMTAGLAMTYFSRGVFTNAAGCLVCAAFAAFGFNGNVQGAQNPDFWIMPVGIVITVGTAPVFVHYASYFVSTLLVWVIITHTRVAALANLPDANWIGLIVLSSIGLGVLVNYLFVSERKKTFLVQRKLIELSFQDALTGISNRRGLMQSIQDLHAKAAAESFYFLIIDIDDFKRVNDTLGHDAGDKVLVEVASVIERQANARAYGRLGGEEFGVVFAGEESAACDFAKKLCESVAALQYSAPAVTVSIGLSKLRDAMSLSEIFRRADQALYEAKHRGKNRYFLVS